MEPSLLSIILYKTISKWITDFNIGPQTLELLRKAEGKHCTCHYSNGREQKAVFQEMVARIMQEWMQNHLRRESTNPCGKGTALLEGINDLNI